MQVLRKANLNRTSGHGSVVGMLVHEGGRDLFFAKALECAVIVMGQEGVALDIKPNQWGHGPFVRIPVFEVASLDPFSVHEQEVVEFAHENDSGRDHEIKSQN